MKYVFFAVLLALVILAGCAQQAYEENNAATIESAGLAPSSVEPSGDNGVQESLRVIDVTAKRFSFEPNPIRVNFGERIRLNITSTDTTHGFALPDFGINETIPPGQTIAVEFVADKRGSFDFYCSVYCGLGHSGMGGKLIVE